MSVKELVALDVEYYMSPKTGGHPTQIAIINENGDVVFNKYFKVSNTNISMSSEKKRHLKKHTLHEWSDYKGFLKDYLKDKIVAGHDLQKDFKALGIDISDYETIDTAKIKEFMEEKISYQPRKLKNITKEFLKRNIQLSSRTVHNALEDATASMHLIKYYKTLQKSNIMQSNDIPDLITFIETNTNTPNYAKNMEGLWNIPIIPNIPKNKERSLNNFLKIPHATQGSASLLEFPNKTKNIKRNLESLYNGYNPAIRNNINITKKNNNNNNDLIKFTPQSLNKYELNVEDVNYSTYISKNVQPPSKLSKRITNKVKGIFTRKKK